jgi:hypothetical protein
VGAGRPDIPSLVSGLVIIGLGAMLLADAAGAFELRFEWLAPAAIGAVGAILLALGLGREG